MEHQQLYEYLAAVASAGKTISTVEVANQLDLDLYCPERRSELARVLSNISYQENAAGRPLLSAVVIMPGIGYPGKEFFYLARELGFNQFSDQRSFYFFELKRVHAYWQMHIPAFYTLPTLRVSASPHPLPVH